MEKNLTRKPGSISGQNNCYQQMGQQQRSTAAISDGDAMRLYVDRADQSIILKKDRQKLRLEERLEKFYGMPIDQIPSVNSEEVDWGAPVRKEEW